MRLLIKRRKSRQDLQNPIKKSQKTMINKGIIKKKKKKPMKGKKKGKKKKK